MSAPFHPQPSAQPKSSVFGHAALAVASAWVLCEIAPATLPTPLGDVPMVMEGRMIHPWPALAAGICAANLVMLSARLCERLAGWLEYRSALIVRGYQSDARFALWKDIKHACYRYGWAGYFGIYAGKGRRHRGTPIFTDFTNFLCFGTAGAGKGVGSVIPMILSLANAGHSMLINDFKPNIAAMVIPYLQARGYDIHVVNIGGLQTDIIGNHAASYNLLQIIIDDFLRGSLADAVTGMHELILQLHPKQKGATANNNQDFWDEGSREVLELAGLMVILVKGEYATLSDTRLLILNRDALLKDMLWVSGGLVDENQHPVASMPLERAPLLHHHPQAERDAFITEFRTRCGELAKQLTMNDQSNMATSFLKGAYNALKPFSAVSKSHAALSHATFRFGDMKRQDGKPVAVILMLDSSRMGQGEKIMAALQSAAQTEWKRHANKHVPVYYVGDEALNAEIYQLPQFFTWAREFSIYLILYIQSISACREVYGKESVGTFLGQSDVVSFLPHQRDPEMLELIEKMLGQHAYIAQHHNAAFHGFTMQGQNLQEQSRPLLTQDEIRRCSKTITFIRNNRPVLTDLPSYAAIDPWRDVVADNPFYNTPYRLPITLRLGTRRAPWWVRLRYGLKRGRR